MKKPIQKQNATIKRADDAELRRWCIERAMNWPTTTIHHQGGAFGQMQGFSSQQEHDVIARAEKLLQWVTK